MALHPKIGVFGAAVGIVVGSGVALYLVGRLTAAAPLGTLLVGVAGGLGVLSLIGIAVFRSLPVGRRLDGLLLEDTQPSWDGYISAAPRSELVGRTGTAATELRPSGVADIEGDCPPEPRSRSSRQKPCASWCGALPKSPPDFSGSFPWVISPDRCCWS